MRFSPLPCVVETVVLFPFADLKKKKNEIQTG